MNVDPYMNLSILMQYVHQAVNMTAVKMFECRDASDEVEFLSHFSADLSDRTFSDDQWQEGRARVRKIQRIAK